MLRLSRPVSRSRLIRMSDLTYDTLVRTWLRVDVLGGLAQVAVILAARFHPMGSCQLRL